ncbi:MAG: ATP-binding cassette domain-containing protein [Candidatus Abyssobacteria bacterium SURF_5]|uniref:ATP-binding cassette domain-containing protein n=1 Tax=Abyssobacteria bacterium (strain SURF_5) TaxID=2093360 RepID=A0A3A4NXC0_ABYX5|nr:MAG: ATP-binding cassette domain-containing protein [Candidatus Abyssubacteria bacterium SURF_5]
MQQPLIDIHSLSFRYRRSPSPVLKDISLQIDEGEFVVLMGPNEGGKSTFCFTLNGLIPHLMKGDFKGSVRVCDMETHENSVKDFFPHVGLVFQDFESQLFSTSVELEIAFGPENAGISRDEIGHRIQWALEMTGIEALRRRQPGTLSGGQKQLLAIASALSLQPKVLCFDEPTTDLDPKNKRRIFSITEKLAGKEILIIAEHETEEALKADRILLMRGGRIVADGPPAVILRNIPLLEQCSVMPLQVTESFNKLGAGELPLTVEEALDLWQKHGLQFRRRAREILAAADQTRVRPVDRLRIEVEDVSFSYDAGMKALDGVSLQVKDGEFIAILGQNGSGKTTLAKLLNGLLKPGQGNVRVGGRSTTNLSAGVLAREVGYVFQNPDHQIFKETILEEVLFGPQNMGIAPEQARQQAHDALETVGLWERRLEDPFTLPKGLRQKVAVASVLATRPSIIVMDEPTTGLDYGELKQMMGLIKRLNDAGHTIIIITHCIWIAAQYAHRIILIKAGKIVADGPAREIFADESLLARADVRAPQIVSFSNRLGLTMLSVEEFLQCAQPVINLDADPDNADWLKVLRKQREEGK